MSDSAAGDVGLAILRRMTPDQKVATVQALLESAWALRAAGIALRSPELGPEAVAEATREAFRRGAA